MRKQIFGLALLALLWTSCQQEDPGMHSVPDAVVQFSVGVVDNSNGRTQASNPAFVKVTVKNSSDVVVVNGVELSIVSFGNSFLTEPLTLKVPNDLLKLTEFVVLNANREAIYATPVEGSLQARFVNDPLAINFSISGNETTVVRPEVLAVTQTTPPASFGYSQFDFTVVETLKVFITATEWGQAPAPNFDFDVMIEGFESESSPPSWFYNTYLLSSGEIEIRKAHHYAITVSKAGYIPWHEITTFPNAPNHPVIFLNRIPK